MKTKKWKHLVQRLAPDAEFIRSWRLEGGLSAGMIAFELQTQDGQITKLILRQPGDKTLQANPHAAEDEYRLLEVLEDLRISSPKCVFLDISKEILSTSFLVIEHMEGKPIYSPGNATCYARQFAQHLASIHSIPGSNPDLSFLPRKENQCRELDRKLPHNIDDWWQVDLIRAALASCETLSQGNTPALLHGDFWPGNLLWRDGKLVGVIDWEDASIGDPLIDLAISRLDLLWIMGENVMQVFTQHYLSQVDIKTTHLPFWDLCAALRLARLASHDLGAWTAFFHPYGRQDITAGSIRMHYEGFINQALRNINTW